MGRESLHTIHGFNLRHQEPMGVKAGETALALLKAGAVKGGKMRAVLDPELAGVFVHEAVGHASEGDLVKEGSSVLAGKIGEQIGPAIITIVDDPSLPEFGFEPVDAEGCRTARTEVVSRGKVNAYLHTRETLAALGNGDAGHGRAEGGEPPLVRMSNTFIEEGDATLDEILSECRDGILLVGSRGGQVDPGRGVFQFNAEYGYLIEKGEKARMVRDVSLSGEILSTLHGSSSAGTSGRCTRASVARAASLSPSATARRISSSPMRWWVVVELIEKISKPESGLHRKLRSILSKGRGSLPSRNARWLQQPPVPGTGGSPSVPLIRDGFGTSATSSPAKWEECLKAALSSMSLATPQEWKGLPEPADLQRPVPSYDERVVPEPSAAREFLAGMLEGAGKHPESKITSGSGSLGRSEVTIANSRGVRYTALRTEVSCSLETICGQSTGSEFAHSPFLGIDPIRVGERAAFFAAHSAKGKPMETGLYDILLSPLALAQLFGNILGPALSGRTVHAGRSRLAPLLGQKCMDGRIDLCDDPYARGMGVTAWDAEGVPAARLDFVKGGVLSSFAYDLKTAYRYGAKSTGSAVRGGFSGGLAIGVHNLVLDGPREEIASGRALDVHDVVGAHTANPVSGDFSVECQNPIWVEGGGFQDPVRKAMLSGNFFDALREIGGIGAGSRIVGNAILPCVRFNGMQVIG